jgi:FKBP-type peptidyl-prolyl cis-trans isomerase
MMSRPALVLLVGLSLGLAGCNDSPTEPTSSTEPGYTITEVRLGTGAEATNGTGVTIAFTMWLFDRNAFLNRGVQVDTGTLDFTIGSGEIIEGLAVGVRGMKVGGQRRLVVPSRLAFGERGRPGVPANSPVVFDVELITVQ